MLKLREDFHTVFTENLYFQAMTNALERNVRERFTTNYLER